MDDILQRAERMKNKTLLFFGLLVFLFVFLASRIVDMNQFEVFGGIIDSAIIGSASGGIAYGIMVLVFPQKDITEPNTPNSDNR